MMRPQAPPSLHQPPLPPGARRPQAGHPHPSLLSFATLAAAFQDVGDLTIHGDKLGPPAQCPSPYCQPWSVSKIPGWSRLPACWLWSPSKVDGSRLLGCYNPSLHPICRPQACWLAFALHVDIAASTGHGLTPSFEILAGEVPSSTPDQSLVYRRLQDREHQTPFKTWYHHALCRFQEELSFPGDVRPKEKARGGAFFLPMS